MIFGEILKQLLEESGISQKQLASHLNIAPTTLGNYIRGMREPDFEILKLFASYFNVTTDYLLDYRSGVTKDHDEDELLRIYRILPADKKELFLEQGKLLVRIDIKNNIQASKSAFEK